VRHQHETLLIAKRGDMPTPPPSVRASSVVTAPRTEHSRKPDVFYELIETSYPARRYGELFARRPREGWASWGNQVAAP
jgi:N6-adenosine-specific RNA methylase IME4